jgi:hypothetical protein
MTQARREIALHWHGNLLGQKLRRMFPLLQCRDACRHEHCVGGPSHRARSPH